MPEAGRGGKGECEGVAVKLMCKYTDVKMCRLNL